MARGYVFATQALADLARAEIDKVEGYPRAGVDVGGGVHVRPTFVTITHCLARKHPTLAQWVVLDDEKVRTAIDGKSGIPSAIDLDVTWGLDTVLTAEKIDGSRGV
jgi:hypothetical protein